MILYRNIDFKRTLTTSQVELNFVNFDLQSLGSFGPLKCREIYALDRLQKQADIIEHLIKISQSSELDLHASKLCPDEHIIMPTVLDFYITST